MEDDHEERPSGVTWYGRLRRVLKGEAASREDLLELLRDSQWNNVLEAEELSMLEGVLAVAETQVREVMVPRSQIAFLERDAPREQILRAIVESGHSRFPVVGDDREEVVGILLAKDVLRYFVENGDQAFDITRWLRPATFIPESKRLNALLKEFRVSRNHIAIVVDEYGGIAGLLTIEDVLEEIVGEIDDEYDPLEAERIQRQDGGRYQVKALTRIEEFNTYFEASLDDENYDTIGGLVTYELGHLPRKGETVSVAGFRFRVLLADRRRVQSVEVTRESAVSADGGSAVA